MNRFWFEPRFAGRSLHQLSGLWEIEIDELAAAIADGVIVPVRFSIVPAGAVAEINLVHQARFFQITKRVVNRCITNRGETLAGRLKNLAGSWVIVTIEDHLEYSVALRRQLLCALTLSAARFHNGFRLILNRRNVKWCQREPLTSRYWLWVFSHSGRKSKGQSQDN